MSRRFTRSLSSPSSAAPTLLCCDFLRCSSLRPLLISALFYTLLGAGIVTLGVVVTLTLTLPWANWAKIIVFDRYVVNIGVGALIVFVALFGYLGFCRRRKKCCSKPLLLARSASITPLSNPRTVIENAILQRLRSSGPNPVLTRNRTNYDQWKRDQALPCAAPRGVNGTQLHKWRRLSGGDLEPVLASGAIVLLDAQWVVTLAEAGGVLAHRQALPEEAFLSLADLIQCCKFSQLPIIALSYPWLTKDHPDPLGANLRRVAKALKALLGAYSSKTAKGRMDFSIGPYNKRLGVFWDFGSLHQHPDPANGVMRTGADNFFFKQGLGCLGTLYSHQFTTVLRLTSFPDGHKIEDQPEGTNVADYFDRGWCFTENALSSLTKDADKSLDLRRMRDDEEYSPNALVKECTRHGGRRPPLLPSAFAAELETKSFTNGKDDKPLVKRLYEAAFEEQFGRATELNYDGLGWGDAEAVQVAELIASGAVPHLQQLNLRNNKIGDAGCKALATALGKEGAVPYLRALEPFPTATDVSPNAHAQNACFPPVVARAGRHRYVLQAGYAHLDWRSASPAVAGKQWLGIVLG